MCKRWGGPDRDDNIHGRGGSALTGGWSKRISGCPNCCGVDRCRTPGAGDIVIRSGRQYWCSAVLAKWIDLRKRWSNQAVDNNIHLSSYSALTSVWREGISRGAD